MEYSDIEVVLNAMQPIDRLIFGAKYLYHAGREKLLGEDLTGPFLHDEYLRQVNLFRMIDAGDWR